MDCTWFLHRIEQRNGLVGGHGGCADVAGRDIGSKEVTGTSSVLTSIVVMKVERRVVGVDPTSSPSRLSQNGVSYFDGWSRSGPRCCYEALSFWIKFAEWLLWYVLSGLAKLSRQSSEWAASRSRMNRAPQLRTLFWKEEGPTAGWLLHGEMGVTPSHWRGKAAPAPPTKAKSAPRES